MHRRSRREIDVLMRRLAVAIVVLTVVGVLASASLGVDSDVFLMTGLVLLFADTAIGAFFGSGSE